MVDGGGYGLMFIRGFPEDETAGLMGTGCWKDAAIVDESFVFDQFSLDVIMLAES